MRVTSVPRSPQAMAACAGRGQSAARKIKARNHAFHRFTFFPSRGIACPEKKTTCKKTLTRFALFGRISAEKGPDFCGPLKLLSSTLFGDRDQRNQKRFFDLLGGHLFSFSRSVPERNISLLLIFDPGIAAESGKVFRCLFTFFLLSDRGSRRLILNDDSSLFCQQIFKMLIFNCSFLPAAHCT